MASLTHSDIQTRIMNALRIPTGNSTEASKISAVMNGVYREIGLKGDGQWWWLVKRALLATRADITTGTASVTNNNTGVTLTDGPATSTVGGKFYVAGNTTDAGAFFRIATHTDASTSVTLDGVYTGSTDTAASYQILFDEYSLATDVGKLQHIRRFGRPEPLRIISPEEMHRLKIWDTSTGKPELAALIDFATTGDPTTAKRLVVHPYPDEIYRLEYTYFQTLNTELSSTTRPLIPDDYVEILVYGSLAVAYNTFVNDPQRGREFQARYTDLLNLMLGQQRRHQGNPSVQPADHYRSFYRRGRRVNPNVADLGDLFDRYPSVP